MAQSGSGCLVPQPHPGQGALPALSFPHSLSAWTPECWEARERGKASPGGPWFPRRKGSVVGMGGRDKTGSMAPRVDGGGFRDESSWSSVSEVPDTQHACLPGLALGKVETTFSKWELHQGLISSRALASIIGKPFKIRLYQKIQALLLLFLDNLRFL